MHVINTKTHLGGQMHFQYDPQDMKCISAFYDVELLIYLLFK